MYIYKSYCVYTINIDYLNILNEYNFINFYLQLLFILYIPDLIFYICTYSLYRHARFDEILQIFINKASNCK